MTWNQIAGVLRQVPPTFGGIIAGVFLAVGLNLTSDDIKNGIDAVIAIGGGISTLGGIWLSIRANSKASIVAAATAPENVAATVKAVTDVRPETTPAIVSAVNNLPDVKGVITAPTPEGGALAAAIPSPTVVMAGTERAKAVAGSPSPYTHGGHT